MEIPQEIRDAIDSEASVQSAETFRWIYALSCSRMFRKKLMRDDEIRLMVDELATSYAREFSSRELKGLAGYHAAVGNRRMTCVYVRAWVKQQRGYAS